MLDIKFTRQGFENACIYQFTSLCALQTSDYDVIIEYRVDSMSLTTSFQKCYITMT